MRSSADRTGGAFQVFQGTCQSQQDKDSCTKYSITCGMCVVFVLLLWIRTAVRQERRIGCCPVVAAYRTSDGLVDVVRGVLWRCDHAALPSVFERRQTGRTRLPSTRVSAASAPRSTQRPSPAWSLASRGRATTLARTFSRTGGESGLVVALNGGRKRRRFGPWLCGVQ